VLPFDSIRQSHDIDELCAPGGEATTSAQLAQDEAKNNFCAAGSPVSLHFTDFDKLQTAAESAGVIPGRVPANRSILRNLLMHPAGQRLSEGSLVRVGAHLVEAHYSNVSKGESVNCNRKGPEYNDIHIILSDTTPRSDLCDTVTAEISPHFRPAEWTPENLNKWGETRRFRFTGQLFFDGSHRACKQGSPSSPPRRSVFEIHPVYAVDVCRTGAAAEQCDVDDDRAWVPLHTWLSTEGGVASEDGQ